MPTVLVTGAGRGLGLEFAKQYAADGWRVIATVRDPKKASALQALGDAVSVHRLDVRDFKATTEFGRELSREAVDVVIANAGISPGHKVSISEIDRTASTTMIEPTASAATPTSTSASSRPTRRGRGPSRSPSSATSPKVGGRRSTNQMAATYAT